MLFFAFTGLLNAIGSALLGLFVFFKNPKEKINQTFSLLCLSITLWALPYCFWQLANDEKTALFWSRVLMVGAIFIPVTFLHFVFSLLNLQEKRKLFLTLSYILASIFFILDFTPLFVKNVTSELYFPYWPKPGIFFHPFLFLFFTYITYGCYLLFKAFKKSKGIERVQFAYFLIASLIGFPSGSTNYFLWYGIPIPPYLNILVIFFPIFTTYGIIKHHLFRISVILTELLLGLISLLLIIQIFMAPTILWRFVNSGIFVLFCIFGWLLIKYTFREIKRREELEKISQAKTEFLSIASHQLRTPLSVLKGYLSMILEGNYGELSERLKTPLINVYSSTERLIKLVNDFLNITKIETGKVEIELEEVDLEELIADQVKELEIKAKEKNLGLIFEKPKEKIPKLLLDKEKIGQAISNLIDNAIRYTHSGEVRVILEKTGNFVKIKVKDTGEGLTKEEAEKLFESFSRGEAGRKFYTEGSGLGLYIAKKLVELHKGKIWVESPGKGKGSTFYIELKIK